MDEYTSRVFVNGIDMIVMQDTCEDSVLASPLILNLLCTRRLPCVSACARKTTALIAPPGTLVVNALFK